MEMILRATLAVAVLAGLAACAPTTGALGPVAGGSGPQYEPGDPCKGVVPELCPTPAQPVVNRTPGEQVF